MTKKKKKKLALLSKQKFGRLKVIKDSGKRSSDGRILWECRCDCNKIALAPSNRLKSGSVKSCGCFLKESVTQRNKAMAGENHPRRGCVGAMKGRKGKDHPMYGYKPSKERLFELKMFTPAENNHNWKGGIASEPYCDVWRDEEFKKWIKERDDNICQNRDCWGNAKKITIHHINYIKKDCHPNNLITLCASCNSRANFNREYWQEHYENI